MALPSALIGLLAIMLGFHAEFVTNFRIPAFVGVGKMVSKGFGLMGYATAS